MKSDCSLFIRCRKARADVAERQARGGRTRSTPATSTVNGEVAEWSKALDSKSSVLERVPWVRIPPSPQEWYSPKQARLAQLVEHLIDVERVRGSSPLPRTGSEKPDGFRLAFRFLAGNGLESRRASARGGVAQKSSRILCVTESLTAHKTEGRNPAIRSGVY